MRILYVSQYYDPEVGAPAIRATLNARHLVAAGHRVVVLAGLPNYPKGEVAAAYRGVWMRREQDQGVEVVRCYLRASRRKRFVDRMSNYLSYAFSSCAIGATAVRGPFDVVVGSSPPLFAAAAGGLLARRFRAPFVFDVRDVWPQAAEALGELSSPLLSRGAHAVADHLYRQAARVICANPGNDAVVRARGACPPERVRVVHNGTDAGVFAPLPAAERRAARRELGVDGDFVVLYAGLHGLMYDLPLLLDAAAALANGRGGGSGGSDGSGGDGSGGDGSGGRDGSGDGGGGGDDARQRKVRFLLVGDGPTKPALVAAARARGLHNVEFRDPVPADQVRSLMAAADLGVVSMRALDYFQTTVPVKLYDYLATGLPVAHSCGGAARELVGCDPLRFEPGDLASLLAAINWARSRPEELAKATAAARGRVLRDLTRPALAARFEEELRQVVAERG